MSTPAASNADDAESISKGAMDRVVSEISEYLGLLFKPAVEELGLMFHDQVQVWRLRNLRRLNDKLKATSRRGRVNPRLAIAVLEQATRTDDELLLNMWAGLLDSSRSEGSADDANITFAARLSEMSSTQARILNHLCSLSQKVKKADMVVGAPLSITIAEDDFLGSINRFLLDQELDSLNAVGMINGAIQFLEPEVAMVQVTALGIYLYVRCQGSNLAPADYFVLDATEYDEALHGDLFMYAH